ncbi:MAG: substrate-binding domain-containing protein [Scytolyngbya sp. HA4215-MV1]|jgi:ribose transport system substrate-binding protein|nr:substrate-binding domain-containing protein [Scytolyngbya sp. HA4215-MV1]
MRDFLKAISCVVVTSLIAVAGCSTTPVSEQPTTDTSPAATTSPSEKTFDRLRGVVQPVEAKKPYRIGIAVVQLADDYWKGMVYGMLDEAKQSKVEVVRVFAAGGYGKVPEQIAQLEALEALKVDAVILGAADYDGYDAVVKRLTDKGIKVLAAGVPVNSSQVALGVTMDEIEIGKTISSYICKQDPKALVITLPGPKGPAWNKLRFDGVQAGAKDCPGMKLVGNTFAGDITIEDGQSQASDLMIKYPDAKYIYAAAGGLGTGAGLATKRMNRPTQVVTSAVTAKTVDLVKDGHIAMVVSEPGILIGRSLIQYSIRLLNADDLPNLKKGGPIPYPQFLIPMFELTKDKLMDYDLTRYDQPPTGWQPPSGQARLPKAGVLVGAK